MPVVVACPHCQRRIQVPNKIMDSPVVCPSCRKQFLVTPGAGAPVPAPETLFPEDLPPERRRRRQRRRERPVTGRVAVGARRTVWVGCMAIIGILWLSYRWWLTASFDDRPNAVEATALAGDTLVKMLAVYICARALTSITRR